jgi:hypothetical protein
MNVSDPAFVPLPRQTGRDAWSRRREAEPLSATTLPHDVQKAAVGHRHGSQHAGFAGMGIVSGHTIQEKPPNVPAVVNRPTLEMSVLAFVRFRGSAPEACLSIAIRPKVTAGRPISYFTSERWNGVV